MIERREWTEFRNAGLLWFINTTLHMFGWVLVFNPRTGEVFPSRCKFRGFSDKINTEGYIKVSEYLKENVDDLVAEAKS
jgi:hypothetical protein